MPLIPRTIEEPKSPRYNSDNPLYASQPSALKIIISQSHLFRGFAVFSRHQFDLAAVQLNIGHAACNLFLDDCLVMGNQRQSPAEFREYCNLRMDQVAYICGDRFGMNAVQGENLTLISHPCAAIRKAHPHIVVLAATKIFVEKICIQQRLAPDHSAGSNHPAIEFQKTFERNVSLRGIDFHCRFAGVAGGADQEGIAIDQIEPGVSAKRSELFRQIIWIPSVVAIQKSNIGAPRPADTGVASCTRAGISLVEIDNPLLVGTQL